MSETGDITDEMVREAVSQIMEMNGLGRDSGWELRDLLEHAADTEAVLRNLISGTILDEPQEENDGDDRSDDKGS